MSAQAHSLDQFNYWAAQALEEARALERYIYAPARRYILTVAIIFIRRAFAFAGLMKCRRRKSFCMRVLNWLRADLRRLSNA